MKGAKASTSSSDIIFLHRQPGANIDGWDLHIPRVKPQLFHLHVYIHSTEPKYLLYEALRPRGFQDQTEQAVLKDRKVHNIVCQIFHHFCWTGGSSVARELKSPVWLPESPLRSGTVGLTERVVGLLVDSKEFTAKGENPLGSNSGLIYCL